MTAVAPVRSVTRLVAASLLTVALAVSLLLTGPAASAAEDGVVMISATSLTRDATGQTYTMAVFNYGAGATEVTMASTAPSSADIGEAIASQGSFDGRVWTVGTLRPGASATLVLVAL